MAINIFKKYTSNAHSRHIGMVTILTNEYFYSKTCNVLKFRVTKMLPGSSWLYLFTTSRAPRSEKGEATREARGAQQQKCKYDVLLTNMKQAATASKAKSFVKF